MAVVLNLVLFTLLITFPGTSCQSTKSKSLPALSPKVLSGDQSLPVSMILPPDAMPTDLTSGIIKPGPGPAPVFMNGINPMPKQTQSDLPLAGQYPVATGSIEKVSTSVMPKIEMSSTPISSRQSPQSAIGPGKVTSPFGMVPPSIASPMNMFPRQMMSSIPANLVLMNIQNACLSLQNFVLGTPMARQIMQSVANMNKMADVFGPGVQCGFPTLSAALRMFLKTCNLITSCPNPAFAPFPMFFQPMSQIATYMFQPPKPRPSGAQVQQTIRHVSRIPTPSRSATKPRQRQLPVVPPMMKLFQSFMYGVRNKSIHNLAAQMTRRNTTQEPSRISDD